MISLGSAKRWLAAALSFCLLTCGCSPEDTILPTPEVSQSSSSSQAASQNSHWASIGFYLSAVPAEPVILPSPTEYDLQISVETAVRADIDATPILNIPLNDMQTLFLAYSFEDQNVLAQAHPTDPELLLFYTTNPETSTCQMYQYSTGTSNFILLNQLGFSVSNTEHSFWSGDTFCILSDITSSDEQIALERALCCFNITTNKWSFFPMDAKKQAYSLGNGKVLIFTPRFDGSRELMTLDTYTMEQTDVFSLSGKVGPTSVSTICPDGTIILESVTAPGTLYSRYNQEGILMAQCLGNPDIPYEDLIYYQLYRTAPLASTEGASPVLTAFTHNDKDYVMPWRPNKKNVTYATMYCRQEMPSWDGMHLLSRSDGWSLWLPLYSVKDTPDYLLWKEETNYWQYVKLDLTTTELELLRIIPISQNRILFQTRSPENIIIWKLLDFADFYPETNQ